MTRKGTRRTQSEPNSIPKQAINILYTAEEMQKITEAAQKRGLTRTAYVKLKSLNQRTPGYISQLQRQIYQDATHLYKKLQSVAGLLRSHTLEKVPENGSAKEPALNEHLETEIKESLELAVKIQNQASGTRARS